MNYHELQIMGAIEIRPNFPLADIAAKLGAALGDVHFIEDPPGTYDEFPSFSAEVGGLSLALLGIPARECQVSIEPITNYTLQIGLGYRLGFPDKPCDASAYFAHLIADRCNLEIVSAERKERKGARDS